MEFKEFTEKVFDEAVKQQITGEKARDIFMEDSNSRDGRQMMEVFLKVLNDAAETSVNAFMEEVENGDLDDEIERQSYSDRQDSMDANDRE